MNPAYALAVLGAALYGTADFLGGWASRRASALVVTFASGVPGLLTLLVAMPFAGGAASRIDLGWGAAAGACGSLGVALLYRAFAIGPVSVAAPLISLTALAMPVVVGVALGERPSPLAIAGIVLAVAAFPLLSRTIESDRGRTGGGVLSAGTLGSGHPGLRSRSLWPPRPSRPRRRRDSRREHPAPHPRDDSPDRRQVTVVPIALGAGVLVGGFLVAIGRVSPGAGLAPLVAARLTMLALFAGILIARRQSAWPAGSVRPTIAAGVLDSLANVAYFLAVHRGALTVVATIISLSPAATVLLARLVLGERWSGAQRAGLAVAAAAILCVSLG